MIANKKEFGGGLALMVAFWAVFVILLSPVFGGKNLLDYMDSMYNSISKESAYYISATREKAAPFKSNSINVKIQIDENISAKRVTTILRQAGADVQADDKELKVSGDLGALLEAILNDADIVFANKGETLKGKYGFIGKQALYDWWNVMKSMEKSLTKQERFKESKILYQARTKAVEPAYNFHGIKAESIRAKLGLVVASLAGYVIYTMWYGFSILFMFEGWGLKLEH